MIIWFIFWNIKNMKIIIKKMQKNKKDTTKVNKNEYINNNKIIKNNPKFNNNSNNNQ